MVGLWLTTIDILLFVHSFEVIYLTNYFDKLFEWMKGEVETQNNEIRMEHGIGYLHCEDRYWNMWVCEVVKKIEVGDGDFEDYCTNATKEQFHFLMGHMEEFLETQFTWQNTDKLIDERREMNRQEAKVRAMEMGYNNYAGGTYWREW